ncbi:succinate dehydrogenase [Cupriavidus sp. 2TAF22]|uniref:succinate dehydrogenase n=1 Tax=unclassified Cupriavidus TaxID=2640874 RepID=UPI003F8DFDCC
MNETLSVATQARLWYWQRLSAMVLALCVVGHIAVIMVAVRGGLSGAEVLARTRGNWLFGAFYACFVLACTVHVPVGLMRIAEEWLAWRSRSVVAAAWLFGALLACAGLRAVYAVVMP